MGKSAKFYKRPSRKEKESKALSKQAESGVSKKTKQQDTKMKEVSMAAAAAAAISATKPTTTSSSSGMDVDTPMKKQKKKKQEELPDYVDLFSGKKTYKRVPGKRK